jgi:hypothetical protein
MTSQYRAKTRLYKVYHIRIKGNDNLNEGYIGVTRHSLSYRLSQHLCSTRPVGEILRKLGKEAIEIKQLAMLPKDEALAMEYRLRSTLNKGWNVRAGGNETALYCPSCGKPMPHKPKKTQFCWDCYKNLLSIGFIKGNTAGTSERYRLTAPDGTIYEPRFFTEFCRQHELTPQNLRKVAKGNRRHHKGWKAEIIAH